MWREALSICAVQQLPTNATIATLRRVAATPGYRIATLWGEDHPRLGEVATAAVDPYAALALSRGGYPKAYAHLDPNEDGALVSTDGERWLLAVADGHNGFDAARAAQRGVADVAQSVLAAAAIAPEDALRGAFTAARTAVTATVGELDGQRRDSGTALSIAVVTPGRLYAATLGDTVVLRIKRGRPGRTTEDVTDSGPFLRPYGPMPKPGSCRLRHGDRVVLASDGLVDFLGKDWRQRCALTANSADPAAAARTLTEQACAGGAGDNVTVVVFGPA